MKTPLLAALLRVSMPMVAAVSCLALPACRSLDLPAPPDDPRVQALAGRGTEPLPFHVLLPAARIDTGKTECGAVLNYPIAETGAEVFRHCRVFASVRLPSDAPGSPGEPPADLRMDLRLHKVEPKFAGRNGAFLPNLLLWSFLVFPSWWVADETYRLHVDLEAVLWSTRSGRRLAAHVASVMVQADLDDFQRGWIPLGILLAPDIFGPGNWRCVTEELFPHAVRSAQLELAEWVDGEVRRLWKAGELAPLASTSFALCAGLSKYDALALHNLRWPRGEAKALAGYLAEPRLGGAPPGHVRLLVDDQAAGEPLLSALEAALLDGPRPGLQDVALVYLSGYGLAREDGKGGKEFFFLPYDADPAAAPSSAFSLKALAGLVGRSNASKVIVVLDAAFEAAPDGPPAAAGPDSVLLSAFREIAIPGKAVVVHVRNRDPERGEGFIRDFTAALVGKADGDANGAVSAGELRSYLAERAPEGGYEALVAGENLDAFQLPFACPVAAPEKKEKAGEEGGAGGGG